MPQTWQPQTVTIDGKVYTDCTYCRGAGRLHPLKLNGKPNYSNTVECSKCNGLGRWVVEPQLELKEKNA